MTVTLDSSEVAMAQVLATMRHNCTRMAGVKNARMGSQSDYVTELEGMASEMAFCKACNLFPDMTIAPRSGGHDVEGRNGTKIDVKATKYQQGHLLATMKKKRTDADYYVLLVGECPTYRIAGYASADDLLSEKNITDFGHGATYALPQSQLQTYKGSK